MPDDYHFAWRINQNVLQRFPGCSPAELSSDRRSEDNRVGIMLDRLVDDRGASRSRLQKLCLNRAASPGETGARGQLGIAKHTFPAGDLVGKLGVERHGLDDFDNIDDGDIDVLVVGDLFDDLKQSPVAGSPADGYDQSMRW